MQSSETSCARCVFLATLLVVLLLQSYASAATWNDFQNRHIAPGPMPNENLNAYCKRMMLARGMTQPRCKTRNTFILNLNNIPQIRQVCHDQSMCWAKKIPGSTTFYYYNSTQYFDLIDCNSRPGTCQYRGTAYHKCIIVGCSNHYGTGDPVHFEAIIP